MTYEEFINKIDTIYGYEAVTSKQPKGFIVVVNSEASSRMGVFRISKERQFNVALLGTRGFDATDLQDIYMLAAELAATPIDERIEHKYNVIVGDDNSGIPYIVWASTNTSRLYELGGADSHDLKSSDYQFTDSEFKDLIEYIKTLPDGEFQAKVAEHGKRLVKED